MINTISNALTGLNNATKKLDNAADNIANASNEGSKVNVEQELLKTLEAKQEYQANAAVLKRTKELGDIFDEIV